MKIARFVAIAISMFAFLGVGYSSLHAQGAPAPSSSPTVPQGWDPNLPLPAGAVLQSTTQPKSGVVYSADYIVKGDFKDLMNFYETNLPKAGYQMSSKVAMPARKVYNRNFARGGRLDSVDLTPNAKDPSSFDLHIVWSPQTASAAAPTAGAKPPY